MVSVILIFLFWFIPAEHRSTLPSPQLSIESAACNLIADAGPDTFVCYPGGDIVLQGSITGNYLFPQWSPSTGLSDPFTLNPVANVTTPTTYTLTAWGIDPDNPSLVVNGDFEAGNTGFVTDYFYVTNLPGVQDEMFSAGTYTVINNPNLVHSGFSSCNDHTPSGINMMVINGAPNLQNVWCQTIAVAEYSWYNVSAWVASVHNSSPAILRFSINGSPIGTTINAPSSTCQWVPFNAVWYSGASTSASLCILNLNTASGGNDFAIDDISMVSLCSVQDEVTISVIDEPAPFPDIEGPFAICVDDVGTYSVDLPSDPPIISYQWSASSGGNIISGQGTPQISVQWDVNQFVTICLEVATRCEVSENCFFVFVEDVPEAPLISGPSTLCPGETVTLYTQEMNQGEDFHWNIPSNLTLISGQGTNEIELEWAGPGEAEVCLEVINQCGSTENCTYLSLQPVFITQFDTVLCTGTTTVINGNTYGNGVWSGTENYLSVAGCDSIVEIEITEADVLEFMFTVPLCPGDSVFLEGAFQYVPGNYIDSFTTVSGCDSVVISDVIPVPIDTTWISSGTCDPGQAGNTITTFSTTACDSIVIEEIIFIPSDTNIITAFSCSSSDTGQVILLLANQAGCDSLVITNTYLQYSDTTYQFFTTCELSEVGTTVVTLTNTGGCDSTVITNTAFLESNTTHIESLVCMIADTGTTTTVFTGSNGCDSLVIHTRIFAGSDTTFLSDRSCSVMDTGIVVTSLNNQYGCDSIIVLTITLENADICFVDAVFTATSPQCYGDKAEVSVDVITGLGPFSLILSNADTTITYSIPSKGQYSFLNDMKGQIDVTLISANGLELNATLFITTVEPLSVDAKLTQSYNGYGVPCNDDTTGGAIVNILSGGTPPLHINWSTGDTTLLLTNLSSGNYFVTVTDDNGCNSTDNIVVIEPAEIEFVDIVEDISCFGLADGSITFSELTGGVSPYMTSLNGGAFTETMSYHGLNVGVHSISIKDLNGCTTEVQIPLQEPASWSVSLGPDTAIAYGDIFTLTPEIIGTPDGLLQLTWSDHECDNCTERPIEIISPVTYQITATDESGCISTDIVRIDVILDRRIYIPNSFTPNGDNINDLFIISSGSLIEIEACSIYDRWGNQVFDRSHFQSNDPSYAWDGTSHGKPLNSGVFAYRLSVVFRDGVSVFYSGDITLIR